MTCRTMLTKIERYINDGDVDGFVKDEEMMGWWTAFLHIYVLCVTERSASEASLSHPSEPCLIQDLVTYKDDATVLAVVLNSHDGWTTRIEKRAIKSDPIHKECIGRWTKNEKTMDVDKSSDWRTYCTGWSAAGMLFIKKAEDFFYEFRSNDRHTSDFELFSEGCHAWWIDNHVTSKDNSDREKKRQRKSGDDDELNIPADYSAWSVFMAV
jgi:hypothetical protein